MNHPPQLNRANDCMRVERLINDILLSTKNYLTLTINSLALTDAKDEVCIFHFSPYWERITPEKYHHIASLINDGELAGLVIKEAVLREAPFRKQLTITKAKAAHGAGEQS